MALPAFLIPPCSPLTASPSHRTARLSSRFRQCSLIPAPPLSRSFPPRFCASQQPDLTQQQQAPPQNQVQEEEEEPQQPLTPTDSLPFDLPQNPISIDNTSATVQAVLDDLADRPEYYLNVSGVVVGLTLSAIVLSAIMLALDSIPFAPDLLRVVGLAYVFWFLNKFLFSATERQRLGGEIEEFVSSVRGTQSLKIDDASEA